jgi:hypothetical protein
MRSVLEHIFEDVDALDQVHRILNIGGMLILQVPFVNDNPEEHARVYTWKSLKRLLKYCGFVPTTHFFYGTLVSMACMWFPFRVLTHLPKYIIGVQLWRELCFHTETWIPSWIHRLFPHHGVIVTTFRSARSLYGYWEDIQIDKFANTWK